MKVLTPFRQGLLASTSESLSVCPGIAINRSSLLYLKGSLHRHKSAQPLHAGSKGYPKVCKSERWLLDRRHIMLKRNELAQVGSAC